MKQLFEFSVELIEALNRISRRKGLSVQDIIRQALALYFIAEEDIAKNKKHRRIAIVEDGVIVSEYSLPEGDNDAR